MDVDYQFRGNSLWGVIAILGFVLWIRLLCPVDGSAADSVQAEQFVDRFDSPKPTWKAQFDRTRVNLIQHTRSEAGQQLADRCELIRLNTSHSRQQVEFEQSLPAARVFDELSLSLSVRSNRPGVTLWLQIVFPNEIDPRNGETLTEWIKGDVGVGAGDWETLSVQTSDRLVTQQLQLLRRRVGRSLLDDNGLYVRAVKVSWDLQPGVSVLALDDLEFGPVITPNNVQRVSPREDQNSSIPVAFNLGRLTVNGEPLFLRMAPYHAENVAELSSAGFNVLWVPRLGDTGLLQRIREQRMWAVAMPPRARSIRGEDLGAEQASLVPFTRETLPVLGWYLGTRITPDSQDELISRTRQIRSADRSYRRPLIADVTGGERVYSRHISMLGISRHQVNSTFTFLQLRKWLTQRRQTALPGSYVWTWIQTEAVSSNAEWRRRAGKRPIVLEPEQLRSQVYAALASGVRGIGYWKTQSLDEEQIGAAERRLAIRQLNLEISLIEDWLATGRLQGQVPFTLEEPQPRSVGPRPFDYRRSTREQVALGRLRDQQKDRQSRRKPVLEAAMIRGQSGTLLLPVYYDAESQFVPGRMAGRKATIVVPGVEETASAYEVSPTGVRSLRAERGTGGMQVVLEEFDQTAIVILTTDRSLRRTLEERIQKVAPVSAATAVELARAKLLRIQKVISELHKLTVSPGDSRRMLQQSRQLIAEAETSFERRQYDAARKQARTAMQLMRILQRAYWDEALWNLDSPVSSPYTTAFQTLPDHWDMMASIGASAMDLTGNILQTGGFEDIQSMVVEGWRHSQSDQRGVVGAVDLHPSSREGRYCLRLRARRDSEKSAYELLDASPVTVVTPPIEVYAGQILHISGWVKMQSATRDSLDGFMIFDSLTGAPGAIRWTQPTEWTRFELIREIHASGPFELTFALTGTGEVQIDGVQIVPHDPRERVPGRIEEQPDDPEARGATRIPLLDRIRGRGTTNGVRP